VTVPERCLQQEGGWLQSGGLSGNNGMRLYGLGVDQVLHVEMVIPSGTHVCFSPRDWDDVADMMYPRTTYVTGYCNHGDLKDEGSWNWQVCEDANDFEDLWYAVRGGGGGTFGVVTSINYQLHEHTSFEVVYVNYPLENEYEATLVFKQWAAFLLTFLYRPEFIGVEKSMSNSCSSSDTGGFLGGTFWCFNGGGHAMKDAWTKFSSDLTNVVRIEVRDNFDSFAALSI